MDICIRPKTRSSLLSLFFNDSATTEIYTLSLRDALPISARALDRPQPARARGFMADPAVLPGDRRYRLAANPADLVDRKSTRLNSSHANISYAVFCLKKKTQAARGTAAPSRRGTRRPSRC